MAPILDLHPTVEKIRELAAGNPDKFIQLALRVINRKGETKPFIYRYPQKQIAAAIREEEVKRNPLRLYILKSRQIGSSTMVAARFFVKTWALDNREALIFAQQEERASELLDRARGFYMCLPPELQLKLGADNKLGIAYEHQRGKISIVSAKGYAAVRGGTKQYVQLSEWAMMKHQMMILNELEQPIEHDFGTEIIIETTGRRFGSEAHEFWKKCVNGRANYRPIFLAWQDDPSSTVRFATERERDTRLGEAFEYEPRLLELYKNKALKLTAGNIYWAYGVLRNKCHDDWEFFLQEYPPSAEHAWRSSGSSYFGTDNLMNIDVSHFKHVYLTFGVKCPLGQEFQRFEQLDVTENVRENDSKPFVKLWARPRSQGEYVIASDSSEGEEDGNFSSTFVIDKYTLEMMCEFHGRVRPDEHAQIINSLGNIYNEALAAPEYNTPGNVTLHELKRLNYGNIYRWRHVDDFKDRKSSKLGWQTNPASRPMMLGLAKRLVQDIAKGNVLSRGIIKSTQLLDEMRTFITTDDGRPEADVNCQDDRVMAWAIAVIVSAQETYGSDKDILSLYKTNPEEPQPLLIDGSAMDGMDPMDVISRLMGSGNNGYLSPQEGLIRYEQR